MKKDNFKWFLMIAVTLVAAATSTNMLAFAPLLGIIAKDLGISIPVAQASFLGIFVFVVAISTLISGTLADRFGSMPIMILAVLATVLPSILFSVVGNNLSILVVFRVLQGFAAGAVFSLIPLVAAAWFSEEEKGLAIGIGMAGVNGGMMIGVAVAPIINQITSNWRLTMSWLGYIDFIVLLYVILLTAQYKKHTPLNHTTHAHNNKDSNEDIKSVFTNPTTWLGIIMCMFISWLLNALNDLTPQYFALAAPMGVGFVPVVAGKLMLLVQVGTVIGSLVGGVIMDKVFKGNTKPVLLIGFIFTAVFVYSILFPAVYNNSPLLMIFLLLAGTFIAFLNPAAATFVAQVYPEHIVGRVVGLWLGIGAFGGSIGIFIGALALHKTGTYRLTITLFAVAATIGLILSRVIGAKKVNEGMSVVK